MKIAILSLSDKGKLLSDILKLKLDNDSSVISVDCYHKNIKNIIRDVFNNYDAIIAIMASGIIIRFVAPFIKSKSTDPAILNIDDNGNFVVSMLSGHLGGANKLTTKIANLIDAIPVITTSTDINKRLGIDTLAKDLYFRIDNTKNILPINKAILEGFEITFRINKSSNFNFLYDYINNNTLEIDVTIEFSNKTKVDEIDVIYKNNCLNLKKQKIVVGIGCKKGKSSSEIENGLNQALNSIGLDINRVDELASGSIKKDEKGLIDLSKKLNIPIKFIDIDLIKEFDFDGLSDSEFVKSKFGIGGVCEPSALICAGDLSKLIYKKTAFNGVTIAIAVK